MKMIIGHYQHRTIKQDLLDFPNRFRPNVHRLQMTCEDKERQKKSFTLSLSSSLRKRETIVRNFLCGEGRLIAKF